MSKRIKIICALAILWIIIGLICWQSSAMAWEIYRFPFPPDNSFRIPDSNSYLIESRYPVGYGSGFVTTYVYPSQPQPPDGIIDYWVFQWGRMNSYNQERTIADMDSGDAALFQPGAKGKFYNVWVLP